MIERETGVGDYYSILVRRKWHFLLPLIAVISISGIFTLLLPKIYQSSATVLVKRRGQDSSKKIFGIGGGLSASRFKAIQTVMTSRSRIEEIAKIAGLDKTTSSPQEYNKLINQIKSGIRIRSSGPNIFKIYFYSSDARLCMKIVNTVCGFFVEQDASSLYDTDEKSPTVLNELLVYYEKRVNEAQGVLTKFKIEHQGEMPGLLDENFAKLEQFQIELANLQLKIKETNDKKMKVEKQLSVEIEDTLSSIIIDENLTPQEKALNDLNARLDSLLVLYTPKHPLVKKTMTEREALKRKLMESYSVNEISDETEEAVNTQKVTLNPAYLKLRNYLNELNNDLEKMHAGKTRISEKIKEYEKRVKNAPRSEQEYAMFQRDLNVNQNIYDTLLARLEQLKIKKELSTMEQGHKFEVISAAQLPLKPISPRMSKNIIVGTILGIIFGVSVTFWAEYSDHSLRDIDTVQLALKVPVLATIPTVMTEDEIIKKRRLNMLIFLGGSFYAVFVVLLVIREMILTYAPNILYLQTYKELFYNMMNIIK